VTEVIMDATGNPCGATEPIDAVVFKRKCQSEHTVDRLNPQLA
jgi:hypothetical protein